MTDGLAAVNSLSGCSRKGHHKFAAAGSAIRGRDFSAMRLHDLTT